MRQSLKLGIWMLTIFIFMFILGLAMLMPFYNPWLAFLSLLILVLAPTMSEILDEVQRWSGE